jgi:hypothetical protein
MYYTETTLYLLWENDKRIQNERSRSPLPIIRSSTRSPSPSPPPSRSRSRSPTLENTRPISFTNRQHRRYISYDSLKVLNDFEEPLKNWHEVPLEYITNSLNMSLQSIPHKILTIFMPKDDLKIVFKVLSYHLNLQTITTKILNTMKLSIPILHISISDNYISDPNTNNIRVNCSLSHIPIFNILGRDKFSFNTTLNELEETTKKCFDAFRNLCRSDTILTELFEKSITQYFDSSRENTGIIIREFLDSQNK